MASMPILHTEVGDNALTPNVLFASIAAVAVALASLLFQIHALVRPHSVFFICFMNASSAVFRQSYFV